jgi:acyl-CoA dehydrogenase
MTFWFIIGFILLSLIVIYNNPKLIVWTITLLAYLVITKFLFGSHIANGAYTLFSIIYLFIAIFFNIKPLRYILSKVIYIKAKAVIPGISETEKLALDAGDPWFEKEVFRGKPNFNLLHSYKKFELTEEEQSFLNNETEQLLDMIDEWHVTHVEKDLSVETWNFMRDKGFWGLVIKKEYGGKGFSAAAHSQVVLKIASRSIAGAITVMVPNSLGPGELLFHYGTEEQKNKFLPRLAKGLDIPCFALTGPTAGSDATSIPDRGVVTFGEYNGNKVLGIKLINIDKRYITLAPVATLVGLAFNLEDPENLLAGVGKVGITCALLPHDHPGLEIGNRLLPLDQAFMNGTIRIKESFIPIDWIIGGQSMAGEGWRMLVECLSIGRSISLPACGTAEALGTTVLSSAYAVIREQFNTAIGNFEGVEEQLGKMGGSAYMANATREFTVCSVDLGIKPAVASAISKYHLTEIGRTTMNGAMDIHGGRGIIMGPNNYLALGYQAVPVGITVEGANIMTRNLLIFGQGMMQCHPFLRSIYESLMDSGSFSDFDKAAFGFVGSLSQNKVRSLFHAFTCGFFANGYSSSKFNVYYKRITRLSSALAYLTDASIVFVGSQLKRKERVSARLGDAMSYLYMACSTLKYFKDNNERLSDEIYVQWSLEHALFNAQNALDDVIANFEYKIIGKLLRFGLFPYGLPYKKPSDELEAKISRSLLNNCETRNVFKSMCYVPERFDDYIGRMEVTFKAVINTHDIKGKIIKAIKAKQLPKGKLMEIADDAKNIGIISQEELNLLNEAADMVNQVIQVDEFGPYDLGPKNAHPDWKKTAK